MALGIYEEEDIRALAEEIRHSKGYGSPMTVKEMTEEIRNVKEVGFSDGYSEGQTYGKNIGREQGLEEGKAIGYAEGKTDGIAEGIEQGKKSQYDEFWDAYQENGNRTDYRYSFAGFGWQDESFKPKYPLIPINGYHMFAESKIKNVNLINLSKASICSYIFLNSKIRNIWKLVIAANIYCANLFNNCTELENLLVEGNIGQNGFNVQWSTKLSKASWISIVNALSSTTSGLSITGSLASVNTAFETSAGAKDGSTSAEWLNLIATKSNWTVNLV